MQPTEQGLCCSSDNMGSFLHFGILKLLWTLLDVVQMTNIDRVLRCNQFLCAILLSDQLIAV